MSNGKENIAFGDFYIIISFFRNVLITLAAVAALVNGSICPNRYYCHTHEVKYGAFKMLNNTYVNVTVVSTIAVSHWTNCTRACIRMAGCESVNIYSHDNLDHCELLSGNMMTNTSSLTTRLGSRHYYLPVSSNNN